ncbi:MAG: glycosyltransferase family 9 protein [Fibrobacterota bacterium]
MAKEKLTDNYKYFWVNYLPTRWKLKASSFFSRARPVTDEIEFNSAFENVRKIVVILPRDQNLIILLQRAIIAVKEHFNRSLLEVVAPASSKDLLQSNPYIDGGIFYNEEDLFIFNPRFRELCQNLKEREFDTCIIMNREFNIQHLILASFSGAFLRIGLESASEFPYINLSIKHDPCITYEGEKNNSVLRSLGISVLKGKMDWKIPKTFTRDVENLLRGSGYSENKPPVVLNTAASISGDFFPPEIVNRLVSLLFSKTGRKTVLFTSLEDRERVFGNLSDEGREAVVPFECDSYGIAAAMMKKGAVFITLNNPYYQLAMLLGVPAVSIFPETQLEKWGGPESVKNKIITSPSASACDAEQIAAKVISFLPG